jgi:hypothetical protein
VFKDVITLCNQQWVGVRAATGSFPGMKLATTAHTDLTPDDVKMIARTIDAAGIRKVVVHGLSPASARYLPALKSALPHVRMFGVWHGTFAAWAHDSERELARQFLELATRGVFERIHFMRRGAHIVHPKAWPHLLPNLPPDVPFRRRSPAFATQPVTCLFGSWNNTWKNAYTNVIGALASPAVGKVMSYAPLDATGTDAKRLINIAFGDRNSHFEVLANVDLCLNATVVDCHPMLELEAIAVNTPTLRSNLDLDFDTGSAYAELMTVDSPHDAAAIARHIDHIAGVPAIELEALTADYRALVTRTSFERYADFLGT